MVIALQRHLALSTLGSQDLADQDAIIANVDQLLRYLVVLRPHFPISDEELHDLIRAMAGPRLRKLADRIVVRVGIPKLRGGRERLMWCCAQAFRPSAHDLHVLGRHHWQYCDRRAGQARTGPSRGKVRPWLLVDLMPA